MDKPDDIQQDVWDAAEAPYSQSDKFWHDIYWRGRSDVDLKSEIARAILAERDRCINVIDAEREWGGDLLEVRRRVLEGSGPRQIPGWNAPDDAA